MFRNYEKSPDLAKRLNTPPQRVSEGAVGAYDVPGSSLIHRSDMELPDNPEGKIEEYIMRTRYKPIENIFYRSRKTKKR